MSARDDYPVDSYGEQFETMCDEIDRLRPVVAAALAWADVDDEPRLYDSNDRLWAAVAMFRGDPVTDLPCETCGGTGLCRFPSIEIQALVMVACPDCEVLPTNCNCTQEGLPYCGEPECDVDWCYACGDEYTEPCARHAEVGRP